MAFEFDKSSPFQYGFDAETTRKLQKEQRKKMFMQSCTQRGLPENMDALFSGKGNAGIFGIGIQSESGKETRKEKTKEDIIAGASRNCPSVNRRLQKMCEYQVSEGLCFSKIEEDIYLRKAEQYAEKAKEQDKKLRETYKKLQKKGYCIESTWDDVQERANELTAGAVNYWYAELPEEEGWLIEAYEKHREEIWLKTIEELVFAKSTESFTDPNLQSYTFICEREIAQLYLTVYNSVRILAMRLMMAMNEETTKTLLKKVENKESEIRKLKQKAKENRKIQESSESKTAREQMLRAKAENERLYMDNLRLGKKIAALENEVRRLKSDSSEDVKDNAEKPEASDVKVPEEPEVKAEEEIIPVEPFPVKGVVFFGGHPNLVNKLRQVHPKWTFVNPESPKSQNGLTYSNANISVMIVHSKHASHSQWDLITNKIPAETPILFVSTSNLDSIESEIEIGWRRECLKK